MGLDDVWAAGDTVADLPRQDATEESSNSQSLSRSLHGFCRSRRRGLLAGDMKETDLGFLGGVVGLDGLGRWLENTGDVPLDQETAGLG